MPYFSMRIRGHAQPFLFKDTSHVSIRAALRIVVPRRGGMRLRARQYARRDFRRAPRCQGERMVPWGLLVPWLRRRRLLTAAMSEEKARQWLQQAANRAFYCANTYFMRRRETVCRAIALLVDEMEAGLLNATRPPTAAEMRAWKTELMVMQHKWHGLERFLMMPVV